MHINRPTKTIIFLSTLSLRRATSVLWMARSHLLFLSTLSLRRATRCQERRGVFYAHFYPRSPCGERPWARGSRVTYVEISIHALLAESDIVSGAGNNTIRISIHALLAESDHHARKEINPADQTFLSTLSLRRATLSR